MTAKWAEEKARELAHWFATACAVLPSGHQRSCDEFAAEIAAALEEAEARGREGVLLTLVDWPDELAKARAEGRGAGLEEAWKAAADAMWNPPPAILDAIRALKSGAAKEGE